jgi:hypothetical protein
VKFMNGLRATIDWYYSTNDRVKVASLLDHLLTERSHNNLAAAGSESV